MEFDIKTIIDIVCRAASLMVREGFTVKDKGSLENIVTSSDINVQHFLHNSFSALLPGSGFLCEEEDFADTAHQYVWIIDPIDGTANYSRGDENCCISVALAKCGVPIMGVVFSPWRKQLWYAIKGEGAFCNGKPIRVSCRAYEQGLLFTAMSTYRKEFARLCGEIIYDIFMECNDFRRFGSAALELCLMAEGRAELFFEMRLMPWDIAAATLILQEAGGVTYDFYGDIHSFAKPTLVLAANSTENAQRLFDTIHHHMNALPY